MVRVLHTLHREIAASRIRHVQRLSSAMNEHGYECAVCSLAACEEDRASVRAFVPGNNLTFCSQTHPIDAAFLPRFSHRLKESKPDVVHYWGRERNSLLNLANRIFGNRPLIATLDQEECVVSVPPDQSQQPLEPNAAGSVPTQSPRNYLSLAVDAKMIAARMDLKLQSRAKDLIWALDCLRVLHRDVFLVFFGDGNYLPQLTEYSRQANADDGVVHFVSEKEQNCDAWFAECDLLWNAAPESSCLGTVVDAMHLGIPVVTADTPATRSAIVDRESGFLVPVGDAAEFARRTNILLNDRSLLAKLRSAASQHAAENFGADSLVQHYRSLYDQVLQDRKSRAA